MPVGYYEMYEKPTDNKKENLKSDKNVRTFFLGIVIIGLFSWTLINKFKKVAHFPSISKMTTCFGIHQKEGENEFSLL